MGRRIRLYDASGIYVIKARTFEGGQFFKPTRRVQVIVGGVLARACARYGIGLRAFVLTSDGLRLLVRADGVAVSRFMQFLLGNISRKLRHLLGVRSPLWHRRFRCEPVLDAEAELEQFIEIIRLSLVNLPGFSCLPWVLGGPRPAIRWYDWNRRWTTASGRSLSRWSAELSVPEELVMEPISRWSSLDIADRSARVRQLVRRHSRAPAAVRITAWGNPAPCHAASTLVRFQYMMLRRGLEAQYRSASEAYRAGDRSAEFPPYCIRPCVEDDDDRAITVNNDLAA